MKPEDYKRTWLEIDLDAIEHNFKLISEMNGGAPVAAIVKADAYGLGAIECSKLFEQAGARYLCVANLDEAVNLRDGGLTAPILILGYSAPEYTELLLKYDITQEVPTLELAKAYSAEAQKHGGKLRCHLALDTGMGRLGYVVRGKGLNENMPAILEMLVQPGLEYEGVFTHFAVADETIAESERYTREQYECFVNAVAAIEAASAHSFEIKHCSNSGACMNYPEYHLDMIRPGIEVYGHECLKSGADIRSSLKIKSVLGPVKTVPAGESISYGRKFETARESRIGVLPIGYADGLPRNLSGQLEVMTPQGPAAVVGRICMDMCMVDLTDLPDVQEGDVIEVLGDFNSVESFAEKTDTIPYTIVCSIPRRVPRTYFRGGKPEKTVRFF